MKKKVLLIIPTLILLSLLYEIIIGAPKYDSIEDYIKKQTKGEYTDVIESNGYYFVLEQYSAVTSNYEILFYNKNSKMETVNTGGMFLKNAEEHSFVSITGNNDIGTHQIIEHDGTFMIISNVLSKNTSNKNQKNEYLIFDLNNKWEYLKADKYEGDYCLTFWFTAIENIDDYTAYFSVDDEEFTLITGSDIEYVFSNNLSKAEVDEYFSSKLQ